MDKNFKHFSSEYSYKIQDLSYNLIQNTGDSIFKKDFTSDLLEEFIYENIRYKKKKNTTENYIKDNDIVKK